MGTKTLGIVAINETAFLDESVKDKLGGEFYTLYVYDPAEATFCCEITPSHYLVPFDYCGKNRLSDEDDSDLRQDLMGDPIYLHMRAIDAISDDCKDTVEVEWDEEEDFEAQAGEYLRANPVHPKHMLVF